MRKPAIFVSGSDCLFLKKMSRKSFLLNRTDNSALVLFRIFFGSLMAWQSFEYLIKGWVTRNLVTPEFTFSHVGFDWLQPLPANGMYWYFGVMGVIALFVALGFRYRFSIVLLTLMWTLVYLMQKTVYNNHHYLLILTGVLLCFMPAGAAVSVDSLKPETRNSTMPVWCSWAMIGQMAVVYLFASLAKWYPGWMDGTYTGIMLSRYAHFPGMSFFAEKWFHQLIAWSGMLFDLLVIPMFLFKRTRMLALVASLMFHAFNFMTLKIGIFPFFALSFSVFFFPPAAIRSVFVRFGANVTDSTYRHSESRNKRVLLWFLLPYFLLQLVLPVRHWFIPGDVLWTEEGHRLSWRMMLRKRDGSVNFRVVDTESGKPVSFDVGKMMTPRQFKTMKTHPDMIWQTAQRIRTHFEHQGRTVAVYADAWCSVNNGPSFRLIDPQTDLAQADFYYFGHSPWILPFGVSR